MTPVIALLANKLPPRLREATALEALGAAVSAVSSSSRTCHYAECLWAILIPRCEAECVAAVGVGGENAAAAGAACARAVSVLLALIAALRKATSAHAHACARSLTAKVGLVWTRLLARVCATSEAKAAAGAGAAAAAASVQPACDALLRRAPLITTDYH